MADEAIPIYKGQDFYVPYFEVKLKKRPLQKAILHDIVQVSYKDSIDKLDTFDITINNWDADKRDFKYIDSKDFEPGNDVELWMGYYGQSSFKKMITGTITSLKPNFPSGGKPTLVISGLNILHQFRTKQVSDKYEDLGDSDIATQIGSRLGVTVKTNSAAKAKEEKYKYLFQDNQYDILFLLNRAKRVGYDLFVEEGDSEQPQLYFGPSQNVKKITYKLKYGASLTQFQPTLSTANQVGKVTVRGWDAEKKSKIEATVTRDDIATKGLTEEGGRSRVNQSFATREELVTDKPVYTEKEARTLATETLERIAKDMIKGNGSTVGLPDLRAGGVVKLEGLGERFSGRYFITATTHSIGDSGYTTQFECRREEL